ncbi:MAG: M48 family metalloprotease [Promethearchaeota archaeon]
MDRELDRSLGVSLPISDILVLILYFLFYPLCIGVSLIFLGIAINDEIQYSLVLNLILLFPFLITSLLFYQSFKRLRIYALEVKYFHFIPSWYEMGLHLIRQVYYVIFVGFILTILLRILNIMENLEPWGYLGLSLILSLIIQSYFIIISIRRKQELLSTAQETVNSEIIDQIEQSHPKSRLISEYRFADIQLPSLFLSAGVMSYGWKKNICLVSRYFNWKLTNEELTAVILHEIGHIANNHIMKSYLIGGTEAFLRTMRIFCVFTGLILLEQNQTIFSLDPIFSMLFIILIFLVFLSSAFLSIFHYYRLFLAEIRADAFSAMAIGDTLLADTLRKLPSTIPSPVSYNQSSFLGFRVALLRQRAKTRQEVSN